MKRSTLLLICLLVFVALVGGAAAWMYFSPGGALAPVTAEDAVQDSFLKIAKNASRFERNTNGVAWVMRIVRNTALDYLKRERKISTVNVDECYDLGRDDPMLERSENAVLLERALARLPEQERKVIYYRYYLDFTVRDIAKETGIPKSTVMRLIRTAEENLKKMLSDRDKDTV